MIVINDHTLWRRFESTQRSRRQHTRLTHAAAE
jgi:hypothetical protein